MRVRQVVVEQMCERGAVAPGAQASYARLQCVIMGTGEETFSSFVFYSSNCKK